MADDLQHKLLIGVYATLAFIVVSLSQTYNLTQQYLGSYIGGSDPATYGAGNSFSNRGFLLHIVVFFLLILLPMFLN